MQLLHGQRFWTQFDSLAGVRMCSEYAQGVWFFTQGVFAVSVLQLSAQDSLVWLKGILTCASYEYDFPGVCHVLRASCAITLSP